MATLPDGTALPGKLFIVEGIDGSGKSTQLDLLHKWLVSEGHLVVFTEWNSSPLVRRTTQRGKKEQLLTPLTFSLLHAADLADRMERQVIPALKAGAIVLADRYIYTAFARTARGASTSAGCASSTTLRCGPRWRSTSRCRWTKRSSASWWAGPA